MTVTSEITGIRMPLVEFKKDEQFEFELDINATGTGTDRLLLAFFDNKLNRYIAAWATNDPLPPGKYMWTGPFNPLASWYPNPIPGILNWTAKVGYIRDSVSAITDSEQFKIPRIVDRFCNDGDPYPFCVGVSNPYPAPGEEIAISGRVRFDEFDCGSDKISLMADGLLLMTGTCRGPAGVGSCGRASSCSCYFCFTLNAPRFEGGYTYYVTKQHYEVTAKSSPVGIWVTAPPTCEDYITQAECEAAGCLWYGGACHSAPPSLCEDIITEADCLAAGCYWWGGGCHSSPQSWVDKYKKELMLLGGMGVGVFGIMVGKGIKKVKSRRKG